MLNVNIRELNLLNEKYSRTILQNISFTILPGNIYSLIGKNGSGKTTLLKSLMSLHNKKLFAIDGEIIYEGTDLLGLTEQQVRKFRRKDVKYVLQDSVSSFDPLKKLEYYFQLPGVSRSILDSQIKSLMLPGAAALGKMYPYEISGGMAQRLSIALALSAKPVLLLLDEPNSGIDYALSNLISHTIKSYVSTTNAAALIITQDISFASNTGNFLGFLSNGSFSGFLSKNEFFAGSYDNTELSNLIQAFKSI